MASWFGQGRRAIFESLAEACDKIDEDLKAELQDQENVRKELVSLRRRAAEADRLAQENQDLRSRLHQLRRDHVAPEAPHDPRSASAPSGARHIPQRKDQLPLTPVSVNRPTTANIQPAAGTADDQEDWKVEAWKNAAKYQRVRDEMKRAEGYVNKRTLERNAWQKYAVDLERKLATFEAKYGKNAQEPSVAPRPPSRSPQPGSSRPQSPSHAEAEDSNPASKSYGDDTSGPSTTVLQAFSPATRPQSLSPMARPSSVQGNHTEERDPGERRPKDEDSDIPEMPLPELPRDSGTPAGPKIKCEPSSDTPVVVSERPVRKRKSDAPSALQPTAQRVKQEDSGSDPILAGDLCDFSPATSIDLDESTRLNTPRKNTESEAARLGLSTTASSSSTILSNHEEQQVSEPPPNVTPSATRVLQPVSSNIRHSRPVRSLKKGFARGLAALAEDGASYDLTPSERMPPPGNESTSGRLSAILNGPGRNQLESPIISPLGRSPATPRPTVSSALLQTPQPRELPFGKGTSNSKSKHAALRGSTHGNAAAVPTPGTDKQARARTYTGPPLRSRPVSALRLEDFKINPSFNRGHDYAYSEVIRNKDERACIPGCVDMSCCGEQFRAMAVAERGNGKRTPEQLTEDRKLLENYLGDEAYRLFSMTKQERDDLWIEAKTRELADRIGKHRHRFSRNKSPPGFWRTDFPDTQEMEQDRADAKKRELEMIQERYREAMRPKGRWLFRDE